MLMAKEKDNLVGVPFEYEPFLEDFKDVIPDRLDY
jgi:hypothetical protein